VQYIHKNEGVNISQVSTLILPRILSVLLDSESDEDWNDGKEEEDRTGAENTWAYSVLISLFFCDETLETASILALFHFWDQLSKKVPILIPICFI
jgi:hypothetical protein